MKKETLSNIDFGISLFALLMFPLAGYIINWLLLLQGRFNETLFWFVYIFNICLLILVISTVLIKHRRQKKSDDNDNEIVKERFRRVAAVFRNKKFYLSVIVGFVVLGIFGVVRWLLTTTI